MNPGPAPLVVHPSPPPPTSTRPFPSVYPNPDATGHTPYPPPAPPTRAAAPQPRTAVPRGGRGGAVGPRGDAGGDIGGVRRRPPPSRPEIPSAATPVAPQTTAPTTKTPSLSHPVQGADGLGFVGETARCDPGDPPAMVVRTALSLAVVCQTGPGSFYYRGERISDGANIELANAVRTSGRIRCHQPCRRHPLRGASATAADHQQWSRRFLGAGVAVRLSDVVSAARLRLSGVQGNAIRDRSVARYRPKSQLCDRRDRDAIPTDCPRRGPG